MKQSLIVQEFLELVKIDVQSRNERKIADVLKNKFTALGLTVEEDSVAEKLGGNTGNIIARLKGDPTIPTLLLSAHMDRVANPGNIKPLVDAEKGLITSDGTSILAADNVSGICAILEGIRRVKAANLQHGDIEVVISVCEEIGVAGARYLDFKALRAKWAYVFDAPGRIGRIVKQAPTKYKMKIIVKGRSAHAGNEPEKGLSAIRVAAVALSRLQEGRISSCTTANFGSFHGGKGTNVVCDYVEIEGEARSTSEREIADYLVKVKKTFAGVATEYETDIDVQAEPLYQTFSIDESEAVAQMAARAMKRMGIEPYFTAGGGGMDGNHFNANGIQTIGIALGYSKNHTTAEQIFIDDMEKCGELVKELVEEVGLAQKL